MFYLDQATRKRYRPGTPFTYGDMQYTSAGATRETFLSLGFVAVTPDPAPDPAFYFVVSPCNDDGSWTFSPRDLDELKKNQCAKQVQHAQGLLKESDFLYARAAEQTTKREGGDAVLVPAVVVNERDQVRAVCKSNCALVMATTTVDELEKLVKAPETVIDPNQPDADPAVLIPNPEPHLDFYPTIDLEPYLTPELI